jgi:hypothetical protein
VIDQGMSRRQVGCPFWNHQVVDEQHRAFVGDHETYRLPGLFGEFVLIGFSTGAGPANAPSILPPFAGNGCSQAIDAPGLITTWLVPAQIVSTSVPLSLHGVPSSAIGCELHAQALVLDLVVGAYPPYQGVTNALRLVVGQ